MIKIVSDLIVAKYFFSFGNGTLHMSTRGYKYRLKEKFDFYILTVDYPFESIILPRKKYEPYPNSTNCEGQLHLILDKISRYI